MARQTFRANLGASEFPLLSNLYGRTVVTGQQDMHYIRPNAFSGSEADKNIGIPQLIFAENVMPFSAGYQSVDYNVPILSIEETDFDKAFYLRDADEARTLFVPADGKCYLYDSDSAAWTTDTKTVPGGAICSVANLKGRTFVCFAEATDFYEWDSTGFQLDVVILTGLSASAILGLVAAVSYLIAWDKDTVYWSSTLDPTDFTPSLSTGAGSEKILSLKGPIVYCKPIEDGFVIYTTVNVIYAFYSNNVTFPWVFKEVRGGSGLADHEHAADEGAENKLYVYSTDGLQTLDRTKAVNVFPTITEFFATRLIETYDPVTKTLVTTPLTTEPNVKLAYIGSRWLVVSYGTGGTDLSYALIYDSALQRWGKVKIDHVDAFEYYGDPSTTSVNVAWADLVGGWDNQNNAWSAYGSVTGDLEKTTHPYASIAFLGKNGKVSVVNFSHITVSDSAVMYLGRFQFIRSHLVTCLDVTIEGASQDALLDVLTSYDGSSIDKTTEAGSAGFLKTIDKPGIAKWQMRVTGMNHILRFRGNFQAYTVQLRTMLAGSR